ncbi:MAG: N-acetylmuramoyl-L-alanine amidase [Emcibacteraceae bacterium]|nr:N-acetylmuramoyl-L-alanine amidase [Emcibacteraceae bacterium]
MKKVFLLSLLLCLTACASGDIKNHKLPYWNKLGERYTADLNMIVIHATELTDMDEAREYGERVLYESGTGASGHYYIDRNGSIEQYVPDNRIANHTSGWNKNTLSIELINLGRYPNWYHSDHQIMQEPYPQEQIDALIILLNQMIANHPTIKYTQGHEDLDTRKIASDNDPNIMVDRKMDPGNHFPWDQILANTPLIKVTPEKEE